MQVDLYNGGKMMIMVILTFMLILCARMSLLDDDVDDSKLTVS